MPQITIVAKLFKTSFEALSPSFSPREQELEISAKAVMNERGGRGTLLLRPSFQIPYLSNSRVLKIDLPPKTDPQVMLEQWIEGRQVIAKVE